MTYLQLRSGLRPPLMSAMAALSLTAVLACFSGPALAGQQDKDQAQPTAAMFELQPLAAVDTAVLPPLDMRQVQREDENDAQQGLAPRYAVPIPVELTTQNSGTWERIDKHTQVWRLVVQSPDAVHLNLGFTRYVMPEHGQLFIYNPEMTDVIRPFTARDNAPHGELWTPPIGGDTLVVELTIPDVEIGQLELVLGSINIGYRKFGPYGSPPTNPTDSGACNVDVVCPEGDPWRLQIPAIGVISTGGSRFCTGFMVNNVRQDRRPYFMTANHCGVNTGNAASLVVFWNYQNSTCRPIGSPQSGGPGDGSLATFSNGSTFRASYATSDFTLGELTTAPNPAWQLSWAGWDRSGANPTAQNPAFPGNSAGVCIHHPNTDEKRISYYGGTGSTHPAHGSSWGCSAFPGPSDVCPPAATAWWM